MNLSLASASFFHKTRRTLLLGIYPECILLLQLALPFFLGLGSFGYHGIQALRMTDFADPFRKPSAELQVYTNSNQFAVRNTRMLHSLRMAYKLITFKLKPSLPLE